jgi:hypothetical protein
VEFVRADLCYSDSAIARRAGTHHILPVIPMDGSAADRRHGASFGRVCQRQINGRSTYAPPAGLHVFSNFDLLFRVATVEVH